MESLIEISKCLQAGDFAQVAQLCDAAIANRVSAERILHEGLLAGMEVIGEKFKNHDIFLPDVLLSAKAMHAGMDRIKPLLINQGIPMKAKIVLGTAQGDLHDIGKNLVGIMLKGAGYQIIDLGCDVPPEKFVEAVREENAAVVGISALLTTTMLAMKEVIAHIADAGLEVKTIIGGAPVSEKFAQEIGADAYGYDAASAVEQVDQLIG